MINSYAIKRRCKELGFTQGDLARACGIKQSTMCLKLNNKRPMILQEAEAITRVLRIPMMEFGMYFFHDGRRQVKVRKKKSPAWDGLGGGGEEKCQSKRLQ